MSDLPTLEEIVEAAAVADQLRIYQHKGKMDCITYGGADSRVMLTTLRMARLALSGRLVDRDTIDYEAAVVEFTRWSLPARLGRRLEQERNRVGAVRVVQAAIGGSDEK